MVPNIRKSEYEKVEWIPLQIRSTLKTPVRD